MNWPLKSLNCPVWLHSYFTDKPVRVNEMKWNIQLISNHFRWSFPLKNKHISFQPKRRFCLRMTQNGPQVMVLAKQLPTTLEASLQPPHWWRTEKTADWQKDIDEYKIHKHHLYLSPHRCTKKWCLPVQNSLPPIFGCYLVLGLQQLPDWTKDNVRFSL